MSLPGVRMGRQRPNCTCKCPPPTPSGRLLQMGEARWWEISFQPWTNSGGGLGATCAWSIVPGSPEGEFKPILIHLLVTVHVKHLKQHFAKDNRYYLLRKHCYGQFFIAFSQYLRISILAKLGKFCSIFRKVWVDISFLLPVLAAHLHPWIHFAPWFFDAPTHDSHLLISPVSFQTCHNIKEYNSFKNWPKGKYFSLDILVKVFSYQFL